MFRSMTAPEVRIVWVAIICTLFVGMFTYGAIRNYTIFRVSNELAVLRTSYDAHVKEKDAEEETLRTQLAGIERTLYENIDLKPVEKSPTTTTSRRSAAFEALIIRRLNEQQKEIESLQRRVYSLER